MAELDLDMVIASNNLDADRRIARRNARMDEIWEQHNSKVNTIIGKLTAAMVTRNPLVKEAHQDLIDFAIWFDEQMDGGGNGE
jgi:hypothetical protein